MIIPVIKMDSSTPASGLPEQEGKDKLTKTKSPEEPMVEPTNQIHTEDDPESHHIEYDLWRINYEKLSKLLVTVTM